MKGLPILIGICGASGSGKSYLSEKLSLELRQSYGHLSIEQFSLDRYYLGAEEKTSAERAKHNFDHPDEIDYTLFEEHLTRLQAGQRVPVPNYDYARSCRTEKVDWVEPCSVLLLDGLHLCYKESIRNLFSLKIFVDTPLPLCEQRRVERDVLERGQSEEVVREQYKNNVIPMYEAFIKPVMDRADMVVSGDHEASVNIRLLWQRLAPLLNQ